MFNLPEIGILRHFDLNTGRYAWLITIMYKGRYYHLRSYSRLKGYWLLVKYIWKDLRQRRRGK